MAVSRIDESLFIAEKEIVRTARVDIASEQYSDNELLPKYTSLVNQYQRLLKITQKVFHISDSQGQVLQRHQSEIRNLLDNANQGFLTFGHDLKVDRQYSAECARIFGVKIAGLTITQLLAQGSERLESQMQDVLTRVFTCSKGLEHKELVKIPTLIKIADKDIRIECKILYQTEETSAGKLVMMILTDITERLKAEEKIRFLSYHDKLTGLYNRAYIEAVLPDLEKPESLPMSIIVIDMNGLKLVNDVFGHQQGDLLLTAMAKVLKQSCQEKDIIVRWGGDEFLLILPKSDKTDCHTVCARIQHACSEMGDSIIPLSASVGTATKESGKARLTELFNVAENRMYSDKLSKGKEFRQSMIDSLEELLCRRCIETSGHSDRVKRIVSNFIAYIGPDFEVDGKSLEQLARLHDIGKVAIPDEILGKPGPLTPSEWEIMKGHSDIGYRMAQSIGESFVADIILALRERWDGSGYPYGLKGEQIPVLARIFSLADTYDVITHQRPYKQALNKSDALREIELGSRSQFDPELATVFLRFLNSVSI